MADDPVLAIRRQALFDLPARIRKLCEGRSELEHWPTADFVLDQLGLVLDVEFFREPNTSDRAITAQDRVTLRGMLETARNDLSTAKGQRRSWGNTSADDGYVDFCQARVDLLERLIKP